MTVLGSRIHMFPWWSKLSARCWKHASLCGTKPELSYGEGWGHPPSGYSGCRYTSLPCYGRRHFVFATCAGSTEGTSHLLVRMDWWILCGVAVGLFNIWKKPWGQQVFSAQRMWTSGFKGLCFPLGRRNWAKTECHWGWCPVSKTPASSQPTVWLHAL